MDFPDHFQRLRVQFSVLHVFLRRLISITLWQASTLLRNLEDFVSLNSLKKCVSMRTSTSSSV